MINPNSYNLFIICWMAIGGVTGLFLLRREAPYGRFSIANWGPMMSKHLGWMLTDL